LCAPVTANASDVGAEAADKVATDSAGNQNEASAKHEDIFDQAFSPLDNAVSDINRDLNKSDGSATPESNEGVDTQVTEQPFRVIAGEQYEC